MKKSSILKSLTTKSILLILLVTIVFSMIALPITHRVNYKTFYSYVVEYTTQKMSDSAILMSTFLADSNNRLRGTIWGSYRFMDTEEAEPDYEKVFEEAVKPFETSFAISRDQEFSCMGYPAIYVEGEGIFCDPSIQDEAESFFASEWLQKHSDVWPGATLYPVTVHRNDPSSKPEYFGVLYTFNIRGENSPKCYSVLFTKYSDLLALWEGVLSLGIDDYAFFNLDYEVLYQSGDISSLDADWIKDDPCTNLQHRIVSYKNGNEIYYSVLLSYENEGLRYIMRVPENIFSSIFRRINTLYQVIVSVLILSLVFLVAVIIQQMLRRLTALSDKMAVVQEGIYDVTLDDSSDDEIGQLASAFNTMTRKIKENVNTLMEKEQREKMLQYNLMISAFDPHFVYNTLNTITRLAEMGRNEEVAVVNDALINCMKNNLKAKCHSSYATVQTELEALEQYITIQNYLCFNTIELKYQLSDEIMQLMIPRFLLQPLAENAILHGILLNFDENGKMIPGVIEVSVSRAAERITISISDNGIGMDEETIEKNFYCDIETRLSENDSKHIGVLNVRSRLSYLYGDDYDLRVESSPGNGTTVIIDIPD